MEKTIRDAATGSTVTQHYPIRPHVGMIGVRAKAVRAW